MTKVSAYPNLRAEMARNGVSVRDMETALNMPANRTYARLSGRTPFTLREAIKLRSTFFPALTIEYLFEQGE